MFRQIMVLLISIILLACSQQSGEVQESASSASRNVGDARIRTVWIEPANPTSFTDLKAEVDFRGDPEARISFQWLKNGEPIPGAIRQALKKQYFRLGDLISVQARVIQAGGDRNPVTSDTIMIGNTAPVVEWVAIGPNPPTSSTELKAVAKGKDLDGSEVTYTYRWLVNGETVAGEEGPSLNSSYFRRGDKVQAAAIPFDGTDWGEPNTSVAVTIQNSPPKIVSTPPEQLAEGATYRYEIKAEDADGDTLRFSLKGVTPKGMSIDSEAGVVEWQVVIPETAVTYEYEVIVEDPEGAKSIQKITLKSAS